MTKKDHLTKEERLDILKGIGRGLVELMKQPIPAYTVTSLAILALGKAKLLSCGVTGAFQGVNTYLAISQQVEEAGDAGFFGLGGMGETLAKGGASLTIGALWGLECEQGRQKYSDISDIPPPPTRDAELQPRYDYCRQKYGLFSADFSRCFAGTID